MIYTYLDRWYDPDWGLDPDQRTHLERLGFGRWLARGRLTADMVVALLLQTVTDLEADARDIASNRADELSRMIQALMRRQIRGLTDEERRCLDALQRLARRSMSRLRHVTEDGLRIYAPDPPQIEQERAQIEQEFPEILSDLVNETTEEIYSKKWIRLGRYQPRIFLGEQARLLDKAARLRVELGHEFLRPTATSAYRAARVRKWKQLAAQRRMRPAELPPILTPAATLIEEGPGRRAVVAHLAVIALSENRDRPSVERKSVV